MGPDGELPWRIPHALHAEAEGLPHVPSPLVGCVVGVLLSGALWLLVWCITLALRLFSAH